MSDGWLRDRPVRPASSDHRRGPCLQGFAPQESHGSGLPCDAQGSYLRIARLAGAWRHRPAESRSVWTGHLSVVAPCRDHGQRAVHLPSRRSSLRHRGRSVLCRPCGRLGLTCGYLDNSVGLSSVLAGKSRKCSIKLHPTSGALQAESPDALTGVLGATNRKRDSRIKSFASCVKTYMKKIGAIVVAALLSPYTVGSADAAGPL